MHAHCADIPTPSCHIVLVSMAVSCLENSLLSLGKAAFQKESIFPLATESATSDLLALSWSDLGVTVVITILRSGCEVVGALCLVRWMAHLLRTWRGLVDDFFTWLGRVLWLVSPLVSQGADAQDLGSQDHDGWEPTGTCLFDIENLLVAEDAICHTHPKCWNLRGKKCRLRECEVCAKRR